MGYASQLGSRYNAETAWSSLGAGLFDGYGSRDVARAPYNFQTFQKIVGSAQEPGYRARPIQFTQISPDGVSSFSSNPLEFMQSIQGVGDLFYQYPSQFVSQGLSGKYISFL